MLTSGGTQLEVTDSTAPPGVVDETAFAHPGEELVYVLAGRLGVRLDDEPAYELEPGDSLHFDAMRTHRYAALGSMPARYLLVAAHPHA
jgi:quercetin dioxygenase-like cupin family protein